MSFLWCYIVFELKEYVFFNDFFFQLIGRFRIYIIILLSVCMWLVSLLCLYARCTACTQHIIVFTIRTWLIFISTFIRRVRRLCPPTKICRPEFVSNLCKSSPPGVISSWAKFHMVWSKYRQLLLLAKLERSFFGALNSWKECGL